MLGANKITSKYGLNYANEIHESGIASNRK